MPHPLADDIPTWLFQINAGTDFSTITRKADVGKTMGFCTHFKVTGAGTVTVRLKMPRAGFVTEPIVVEAGETVPGKVAEIVSAPGCFPITVWK